MTINDSEKLCETNRDENRECDLGLSLEDLMGPYADLVEAVIERIRITNR